MTPTVPAAAPNPPLMTAEEFVSLHGDEPGVELVKGRVVPASGYGSVRIGSEPFPATMVFGSLACHTGRVRVGVTAGAFTPEAVLPDFMRARDDGATPAVVFDHRRLDEGLGGVLGRVGSYLNTGVTAVVVLAPKSSALAVYTPADALARRVDDGDELTLPDVLPGFAVPVRRFFE